MLPSRVAGRETREDQLTAIRPKTNHVAMCLEVVVTLRVPVMLLLHTPVALRRPDQQAEPDGDAESVSGWSAWCSVTCGFSSRLRDVGPHPCG